MTKRTSLVHVALVPGIQKTPTVFLQGHCCAAILGMAESFRRQQPHPVTIDWLDSLFRMVLGWFKWSPLATSGAMLFHELEEELEEETSFMQSGDLPRNVRRWQQDDFL